MQTVIARSGQFSKGRGKPLFLQQRFSRPFILSQAGSGASPAPGSISEITIDLYAR